MRNLQGRSLGEVNKRRKMRIAITAQGKELSSKIETRFGQTKWLIAVDTQTGDVSAYNTMVNLGTGILGVQTAQNVVDLDVEIVITGNIGPNAFTVISTSGIKVFLSQGTIEEALALFKEGKLNEAKVANVPTHWSS